MVERVPIGKRMVALGTVFSHLHHVLPRRPLSPVCALGTSPKRGSALRGEENALTDTGSALRGEAPPHPPAQIHIFPIVCL